MKKLFSTFLLLCVLMGVNAQKNANGVIKAATETKK